MYSDTEDDVNSDDDMNPRARWSQQERKASGWVDLRPAAAQLAALNHARGNREYGTVEAVLELYGELSSWEHARDLLHDLAYMQSRIDE